MIKFESESHLQNFLFENINLLGIDKKASIFKELKIGSYGIVDLISFQFKILDIERKIIALEINVIELKNINSGYYELAQLCRYVTGIKEITRHLEERHLKVIINGMLVCPSIELSSDFSLLYNFINDKIVIKTFKINPLKGIFFESEDKKYIVSNAKIKDINDILPSYSELKTECIRVINDLREERGISNG